MLARRSLTALAAPLLLLAALVVSAVPDVARAANGTGPTTPPTTALQIASAAAGATGWVLDKPVRVVVTGGTLTAVTLTRRDGRQVRGVQKPTGWRSTGKLVPRTTYVLDATAVAPDGQQAVLHDRVRTGKPPRVLRASIRPTFAHRRRRPAGRGDVQPVGTPQGSRRGRAAGRHQPGRRPGLVVLDLVAHRAVPAQALLAGAGPGCR